MVKKALPIYLQRLRCPSLTHKALTPLSPSSRYVSALSVVDKALADEAAKGSHKELQALKGDLLGRMGWAHLARGEEEAHRVKFPKDYQPF